MCYRTIGFDPTLVAQGCQALLFLAYIMLLSEAVIRLTTNVIEKVISKV